MKKLFALIMICLMVSCSPKQYVKQNYKYDSPENIRQKKAKIHAHRDGLIIFATILFIGMEINHDSKK